LAHLDSRKILSQQGNAILRWGHTSTSTFNIQEDYQLKAGHGSLPREEVWNKIWETKYWPKISTFLWLTMHNNILTWDNLRKRGFIGPSWCQLCGSEEETQNHLLNLCSYISCIWDHSTSLMRTTDINHIGIWETLVVWCISIFQYPILNKICRLLPGFILWKIWKERNQRIFKSATRNWQEVWATIHSNIKETISLHPWMDQDLNCPMNECIILNSWKLQLHPLTTSPYTNANHKPSPTLWEALETGCHKLNFDGASKGNPGPESYGAIIRNSKGEILHIVAVNLGHKTNNVVEIWGLLRGLQAAKDQEIFLIIAEGDSQIVIRLLCHLLNGADPEKISPSWRLMNGILKIKSILQPNWVIFPSHVRRSTNQVVDLLANYGVNLKEGDFSCSPTSTSSHPFVVACINIANTKYRPPDGVLPGTMHGQATGRPPGQTIIQLAPDGTRPPGTSPQGLNVVVATPQTTLASNLPHDLEALQRENFHGVVQVTSLVTSSPQIWCPYSQAWEYSSSFVSQCSSSPDISISYSSPSLECSSLDLTDPYVSPLHFHPQATDSPHHAPSER